LLAGIGERNDKGKTNFLVVSDKTTKTEIEEFFEVLMHDSRVSVILIEQHLAELYLRQRISEHTEVKPCICEIPSKEHPYNPSKDPIMNRASKLLYGKEFTEGMGE